MSNFNMNEKNIKYKIVAFLTVFIPYIFLYEFKISLGLPNNPIETRMDFEKNIPIFEFSNFFYSSIYPILSILPFLINTNKLLLEFVIISLINITIGMLILYSFPFICSQNSFQPVTYLGKLLVFARSIDSVNTALPSFHVIWSLIGGYFYCIIFKKLKFYIWLYFILIIFSTITVGMHSIADISAAIIVFFISICLLMIFKDFS
jgi:membrane-associated phospholipid phosphatase